jgi:hypothetical protein
MPARNPQTTKAALVMLLQKEMRGTGVEMFE